MHLSDLTMGQWIVAALAALCVGISKGGLAGVGLFSIILMAEVVPARESTGALLPLLVCGDLFSVLAFRRHAQWSYIWRTLPPAAAGVVAGFFLMGLIPAAVFRPLIGWIVLSMLALQLLQRLHPSALQDVPHTRWFGWLMGGWSGVTTMVANAAGPVMTLYLLAVELPKFEFVGTIAWFFLVINVFKLPFSYGQSLISGESLAFDLLLVPGVLAGIVLGRILIGRIPQKLFEALLIAFAAAGSVRLVWAS